MKKILIVDDDKDTLSLFKSYLETHGYDVTTISRSSQAIETALMSKPDLFIIDLMMPDPDGFKLCRLLRTFPSFFSTPILIVTALSDEDSRAVAYGAGANDYLSKPVPVNELGSRVKKLLEKE